MGAKLASSIGAPHTSLVILIFLAAN